MKSLYEVMVNVGAISIGFLATILALLFSLSHSRTLKHVKQAGRYTELVDYILSPTYWFFGVVALSTAGIVIESEEWSCAAIWTSVPWLGAVVTSFMSSFRAMKIMVSILKD